MSKPNWAKIAAVIVFSAAGAFAQSGPDSQLRYKVYYRCNSERVQVDHCRKDDDRLGYGPPTKPQGNYCLVYYPDRPLRGGLMVQSAELYDDIVKKLQACGALATAAPSAAQSPTPSSSAANQDAYYVTGMQYFKAKDYARAIPFLREAARHNLARGPALVYLGTAYYMLKQYQDAATAFEQCIRIADDANMEEMLGMAYAKAGKKDEAMATYLKLQSLDRKKAQQLYSVINEPINMSTNPYLTQANNYLDQKQYASAIPAYNQAITVQPSSDAYLGLGYSYYLLGQYQNALEPFEQAVRLKPDDSSNHYWAGVTHYQLKQYPAALTELQEAIRLNPNQSLNYHWLGEVYLNGYQQYDKAVAAYLECRRLDPSDARNHNELGLAYDSLKQYENALAEFQEAVRLKPDEPLYQSNLGIAYLRLKKIDETEKVEAALNKLNPKMAEELDKQIFATMYDMQHANKQPSPNQAPVAQPAPDNRAETYFAEADKYYLAKDYAKAVPLLVKAVQLKPDFANAWGRLAMSYYTIQQYKDALIAFQQCVKLVPNSPDAEFALGMTYLRLGNKEGAAEAYKKLQSMSPDEARQLYAQIQGQPETSAAPPAPARQPEQPSAPPNAAVPMARQLILMGSLNERQGKQDEALENYQRAIALHPDPDTLGTAYLYLGSLYSDQKKYAEAVTSYQESLHLQPKVAHTSYLLGIAYLGLGKKDEAVKVYQNLQLLDKNEAAQLYRNIQNTK